MDDLFDMLEKSSYYNPFNPGLLKFLADKMKIMYLINYVKSYEEKFSCISIKDTALIAETKVIGISERESTLIVNALLENKVTIGKLWNICTPKYFNHTLFLDPSSPLLEFYYSVKVCMFL